MNQTTTKCGTSHVVCTQSQLILDWCERHLFLVKLLGRNMRILIDEELPRIRSYIEDLETMEKTNTEMQKVIDKSAFDIAMLSSTSVFTLVQSKIEDLKKSITYFCFLKNSNNIKLDRFIAKVGDNAIRELHVVCRSKVI